MQTVVPRYLTPAIRGDLAHFPTVILEGARQVGKSTLVALLGKEQDAIVTTLDDPEQFAAAREDPTTFVRRGGTRPMVIDELQRLPELTLPLKAVIDQDRRPGRFILTGSASLLRLRGLADSLAGRASYLTLYGFSQGESLGNGARDDFATALRNGIDALAFHSSVTAEDYLDLLTAGSYPGVQTLTPERRARWYTSYLRGILDRDIPEIRRRFQPERALALLQVLAANQAGELVHERVARATGIPATTLPGYIDLMGGVGLLDLLRSWGANLTARETARRKVVFPDAGLAARLMRTTADQLSRPSGAAALGALTEGFVAAELLRQRGWTANEYELYHYRDRNGLEVDLIVEFEDGTVLAIEVKAATGYHRDQFTNLLRLRALLGDRLRAGVVLNRSQHGTQLAANIIGLPIAALWQHAPR